MNSLFRGYVPTKDKKCLMKFKGNSPLKTLDEVKNLSEYAGILAENVVLIDVDDFDQSEKLFDIIVSKKIPCCVYKTTRGKHFFFSNIDGHDFRQGQCKTHTKLVCGITADIKVGCRNSYSVLKYNKKEREIIYGNPNNISLLPKWLLPVRTSKDFLTLESGDGRNQALFTYILTLQSKEFTVEEIRESIRIINDYIIPEPLEESELDTLLRDEAFQRPVFFNDNGTFLFNNFARYIRYALHIVKINDRLHIYHDGIYVDNPKMIESAMIKMIPTLKQAQRKETLAYLDLLITENTEELGAEYIAFSNGIYNIETHELCEFSPDMVITNKINHAYNYEAYSEIVDKTLDKLSCEDDVVRDLLEEAVGYTFYRRNELRKAFILIGDKANGKSTYLDMITTLLGDENTCSLDLAELGERFKTAELFHKLANIGDDIGDDFIANPAVFKKLTSGDRLNAEYKGQDPFDFNSYAKMLFSANNIPRIKDKSGAVISRLIIIPFRATFSKNDKDYDPYIKYKLRTEEAMEYLIQVGLEGLERVLKNRGFTISASVQKELEEYEEANNPILLFFKGDPKIENEPTNTVHRHYTEFCIENGFTPMSNIEFSKQVKKYFDLDIVNKTIGGKKYRVFISKEET